MLRNVVPFERVWKSLYGTSGHTTAIVSFIRFLEKRLGAELVFDTEHFPLQREDLLDLFELAEKMRKAGVISSCLPLPTIPDEPRLSLWRARFRDTTEENMAGGGALNDDHHALTTTLAEALERHIWFERNDYFDTPTIATTAEIARKGLFLAPESYAGLSQAQRKEDPSRTLLSTSKYFWIRGISLKDRTSVWVPAQTVSAHADVRHARKKNREPLIRRTVTTGLATHPQQKTALLLGALEVIERDAYIISWLNHLSPPQVDLEALSSESARLTRILEICTRYRLKVRVLRLPTDAPAYALMAILEDETHNAPRFAFGLKAHGNLAEATEKAILEALRGRRGARASVQSHKKVSESAQIGHYERIGYWADGDNHKKLLFLLEGKVEKRSKEVWEEDSKEEHLARIVSWCTSRGYDCVSVAFTSSKANVTPWHVEMVIIPQMQPLYYSETLPHIGGARLHDIPRAFGYTARTPFFTNEPHPFA